jgi:hypothetical protein
MAPISYFLFDHPRCLYIAAFLMLLGIVVPPSVTGIFGLLTVVHYQKHLLTASIAGEWQFTVDLSTPAPSALAAALASSK